MLSKIANWVVWSPLILFIAFLVYRHSDSVKTTADHAVSQAKSIAGKVASNGPASDAELNQARDAYEKGDVAAAVNGYKAYLAKTPGNADAHGELGNIFYATGNIPEAGLAYYNAANLLIDQKQPDRADALMPLISQINPALASDLSARLAQATEQPADNNEPPNPGEQPQPPQNGPSYN
jgi:thioredoxin-like negative regulator of GroEL